MLVIGAIARFLSFSLFLLFFIFLLPCILVNKVVYITTAYLIKIKYAFIGFNYHLSDVNIANFNKIHGTVSEQQLF